MTGAAQPLPLDEPAPWRGANFLRLTGKLVGTPVRVSASTTYTTSARLRRGPATLTIRYIACAGQKPKPTPQMQVFRYSATSSGFEAFPVTYTTPKNACWIQVEINSLTGVDVDDVR